MSDGGVIDLRSDTLTRPGPEMREAMARAEVGDDVYAEDPTVCRLEEEAARLTGHEASLFVPTGTMGNQIAINLHVRPGCDVLLEDGTHVYRYELGAMSAWSGALPRVLVGQAGRLRPEQIAEAVAPDVYYMAPSALLVLENSYNHAGGIVMTVEQQTALIGCAREHGLRVHLDGARVFNAAVALGIPAKRLTAVFDTVMFCLSKGLGAPVGSMLCGSAELIRQARVVRKRMGGGMRQAGVVAAGGLYALLHNVERLADDHARALRLAHALAEHRGFEIEPSSVETNIVIANVADVERTDSVLSRLREGGVIADTMGPGRIRFVTHLDVDDQDLKRAIDVLRSLDTA
jgi:threonine aldolase